MDERTSVRCSECGFLALRRRDGSSALEEAHEQFRDNARVTHDRSGNHHDETPICFVRAAALRKECGGERADSDKVAVVIHCDRQCSAFVSWEQGFSPKEHVDKMYNEILLKMRRDESDVDRAWRERQAEQDHAWREQQAERDREWRKEDRSLAMSNLFVAAGVGIASAVATLIAAKLLPWSS